MKKGKPWENLRLLCRHRCGRPWLPTYVRGVLAQLQNLVLTEKIENSPVAAEVATAPVPHALAAAGGAEARPSAPRDGLLRKLQVPANVAAALRVPAVRFSGTRSNEPDVLAKARQGGRPQC
ncbi:hypothetical protein AK812_SmicGene4628 [Symbiodinium microadriaticum]|uniref:Uncharacterized protein n=1 Tax=Symbiodinium microadriaticum TaxID=2951 RepID=A0A1Q9EVP8_SYMMI|nr:hypothetical protein AK812_SmicGene4628 [Symbiodinium microadriaticum]